VEVRMFRYIEEDSEADSVGANNKIKKCVKVLIVNLTYKYVIVNKIELGVLILSYIFNFLGSRWVNKPII
jgi:hypothetical protein